VLGVSQAYRLYWSFESIDVLFHVALQIIGGYSIDSADATGKERSTIRAITAYNPLIHNYTHFVCGPLFAFRVVKFIDRVA